MKIISRYIIIETLIVFFIGFFIFTFFLVMNSLFVLSDLIVKYGVNALRVIKLLILLLPSTIAVTVPMAFLVGVLLTYSRLIQDNEYYGMQASGISVRAIALPGLILSVIVMAAMILFNNYVLPAANLEYKKLHFEIVKKRSSILVQEHAFVNDFEKYIFYIDSRDSKTDELKNVLVFVKPEGSAGSPPKVILSNKGLLMSDEESYRMALKLNNGIIQLANYDDLTRISQIGFNTNFVDLDIKNVFRNRNGPGNLKGAREMTIQELAASIKKAKNEKQPFHWAAVELHKKFSIPFAAVAFALVGIPLGLLTKKGGRLTAIGFSIILIFIYYTFLIYGQTYGYRGKMDYFLSAWIPNIFLVAMGILFFVIMRAPAINRLIKKAVKK